MIAKISFKYLMCVFLSLTFLPQSFAWAHSEIWTYQLYVPHSSNPDRGVLISRKGGRFLLQTCSPQAMAELRAKQGIAGSDTFKGIQQVLERMARHEGCKSMGNKLYVIDRGVIERASRLINNELGRDVSKETLRRLFTTAGAIQFTANVLAIGSEMQGGRGAKQLAIRLTTANIFAAIINLTLGAATISQEKRTNMQELQKIWHSDLVSGVDSVVRMGQSGAQIESSISYSLQQMEKGQLVSAVRIAN